MSAVSSPILQGVTLEASVNSPAGTIQENEYDASMSFTKGLPAREVHLRAQAARRLQGKAHYLLAQWLLEVEERKLYIDLGYSSVYQYGELSLHLEGHTVAEYLRTGRALLQFPLLADAYEKGRLSASKLREITRVVRTETERYWLEKALTSTTRQLEKMVVFSPRQRCAGNVALSGQPPSSQGDCPSVDCPPAAPDTLHSVSAGHPQSPTVGFQEQLMPHYSQCSQTDCPPGNRSEERGFPTGTMHKVDDAPVFVCYRESSMTPQAHRDGHFHEEQPLNDIPPRKYLEKMVLEFSGEQAVIVHDALKKARKESGLGDRASLVTYLARAFLDGMPDTSVPHSKKPAYQVVLHHQSGITWAESERGPVYVSHAVCEQALCDAEIVEVETAADECRHLPLAFESGEQAPPLLCSRRAGSAECSRNKETKSLEEEADSAGSPVYSVGQSVPGPSRETEFECVSPGESVNRLFRFYRQRARKVKEADTGQPPATLKPAKSSTRTMPLSLRKKVLLRDGGRCQAPGCGRTRFVEVHHVLPIGAGGVHDLMNALVLCHSCHNHVHEGRISVEGEAPGRLRWRRAQDNA